MLDLPVLCSQVEKLAREAGTFIRESRLSFSSEKIEFKGHNNLVSYVDREAENRILSGLKQILPESGILAEESGEQGDQNALRWIVDPLDGTTNFIHGIPLVSVSIALMQGEKGLIGVVYEPYRDEMFSATLGGGAFLNGDKLSTSSIPLLSGSLIATGFPYTEFDQIEAYLSLLHHLMRHTHGMRRMGTAAIDLAYVACGRFEGFFEYNLAPWDVAAGIILVSEAGGQVSDFKGGQNMVFGKQILASNSGIYSEMLGCIQRYFVA